MTNQKVDEIDRSIYDFRYEEDDFYRIQSGLTPEIVEKISEEKHDPEWMRQFRLKCLDIYNRIPVPRWGAPIDGLDMDDIATYVRANTDMKKSWEDVPEDIKDTFEKLGIPQAERAALAGVGAQYDSELVYHNVKDEVAQQGVIYSDLESALTGPHAQMIRDHFMKLVPPNDHKFAALHGAVWSGGSFVYVPPGIKVEIPLQSYFRLNAKGAGQFEHTLIIVDEGADLHFIEGCSAPKYNVANLHAGCVELYVRKGRNSHCEFTGVTFAGQDQNLDTGAKMIHLGRNTSSFINTKSICKSGGISTYRSSVEIKKSAENAKAAVSCGSLMLDSRSRSDTIPAIVTETDRVDVGHEATIGRISDDAVFYLMARGLSEEDAKAMIVSGFASDVSKELPLEYAAEMNNLIKLEMSIG